MAKWSIVVIYTTAFIAFGLYYTTEHDNNVMKVYGEGIHSVMEEIRTDEAQNLPVYIFSGVNYSLVLFYSEFPADAFLSETIWENIPKEDGGTSRVPMQIGRFHFRRDLKISSSDALYICETEDMEAKEFMEKNHMNLKYYGGIILGTYHASH